MHLLHSYSNTFIGTGGPQELIARAISGVRHPATAAIGLASARQLREREVDRLIERYLEVRNMRQVAREWQISRTTVAKHLADRGIDTSKGMKPEDIKRAKELYAQGMGSGRIGRMLGFDNKTILQTLRLQGMKIQADLGRK